MTILVDDTGHRAMSTSNHGSDTMPPPVPGSGSGPLDDLLDENYPRMLMVQTTSTCNSSCCF